MSGDGRLPERLYSLLVALYPPEFRRRFGRAMVADFQDLAARVGRWAAFRRALKDVTRSLPSAWLRAAWIPMATRRGAPTGLLREGRFAARALRRDPGFSIPAIVVLGLAVGVGTAVLSVVNAYLLRPLPYPESDRLVHVSPPLPLGLQEAQEALEIPLTWELDAFTLTGGDRPEQVLGSWVTPGFFEAYGIAPALGRTFLPSEWGEGAPAVAVLSHGLWQRRYGGDPEILGMPVRTYSSDRPDEAEVFTVVGVLPPDLWLHHRFTDFVVPIRRLNRIYEGRVRSDIPVDRAEEILTGLARGRTPELEGAARVELTPLDARYVTRVKPTLVLLASTVLLVLLIACGNVAVLFLVRAQRRHRELAVRRALGASRGAVAANLIMEGVLLSLIAGAFGAVIGVLVLEGLGSMVPGRLGLPVPGGVGSLRLDATAFSALATISVLSGLAFGLLPLLGVTDRGLVGGIAGAPRADGSGRRNRRIRDVVMVGELALSLTLMVAAGLSLRSARHLDQTDLGFDPERLTIASAMIRERSYPDPERRLDFQQRLAGVLNELPGVTAAGLAVRSPVGRGYAARPIETRELPANEQPTAVRAIPQIAGREYFETLGLSPMVGRTFGPDDLPGSPPVALVSRDLAQQLWPGAEPIGKHLREVSEEGEAWRTVVGVLPDVEQDPMGEPLGDYYFPITQEAPRFFTVYLRTREGSAVPIRELERAVAGIDPEVAVAEVRDVAFMAREIAAPGRFLALLLSAFGGFAVLLAVLGLYGTVAYAASQRRFEVAVRMALGARQRQVSTLFVRERLRIVAAGLALGLSGAVLAARLLAGQLRGVGASDPITFATSGVVMTIAAVVAVWIPARAAARSEPMRVLREE